MLRGRSPIRLPPFADRVAQLGELAMEHTWDGATDHVAALLCDDWLGSGPLQLNADLTVRELRDAGAVMLTNARAVLWAARALGRIPPVPTGSQGMRLELLLENAQPPFRPRGFTARVRAGVKSAEIGPHVAPLHWTLGLLVAAGLLRDHGDGFTITDEGKRLLARGRGGELYVHLFRTMFRRFDLAYLDLWPPVPLVQDLVPHWLWILAGASGLAYVPADLFVQVVIPRPLVGPLEKQAEPARLRHVIQTRVLDVLADFGLLAPKPGDDEAEELGDVGFRVTPLFRRFLRFGIPPSGRVLFLVR